MSEFFGAVIFIGALLFLFWAVFIAAILNPLMLIIAVVVIGIAGLLFLMAR